MNTESTNPQRFISQDQAMALYQACQSVVEHRDCVCDMYCQDCSVCQCVAAIRAIHSSSSLARSEPQITRQQFLDFFRSDDFHEQMTDDDCREIFAYSLKGRSDFTEEFLNEIFSDYSVENLKIINLETPEGNS